MAFASKPTGGRLAASNSFKLPAERIRRNRFLFATELVSVGASVPQALVLAVAAVTPTTDIMSLLAGKTDKCYILPEGEAGGWVGVYKVQQVQPDPFRCPLGDGSSRSRPLAAAGQKVKPFLAPVIGQTVSSDLQLQNASLEEGVPSIRLPRGLAQDRG